MRRLLLLGLAALTLSGCGAAERQQTSTSASASDRVVVTVRSAGKTTEKTVNCDTVTDQCKRLRDADFSPVEATACTQVYGGDATATVKGKAGGRAVDATFTLQNGCEIDRWREFSWLLGDPPGQP